MFRTRAKQTRLDQKSSSFWISPCWPSVLALRIARIMVTVSLSGVAWGRGCFASVRLVRFPSPPADVDAAEQCADRPFETAPRAPRNTRPSVPKTTRVSKPLCFPTLVRGAPLRGKMPNSGTAIAVPCCRRAPSGTDTSLRRYLPPLETRSAPTPLCALPNVCLQHLAVPVHLV